MTTIALDAMGGDFAPRVPVQAALDAARLGALEVVLVGDENILAPALEAAKRHPLQRIGGHARAIRIHHAPQTLDIHDPPTALLKAKEGASIRVACELVRDGEADAVVSAGSSGGLMVAAKHALGLIPGVERPAIGTPLPLRRGTALLLDSGANVDCKPEYLVQFAHLGACYARQVLQCEAPRIALLSNGAEASKGDALTRSAHALLARDMPGFIGNVEGRDLFRGRADVIVTDGFVGNLVLKAAEATARQMRLLLKDSLARSPLSWLGYLLVRPALTRLLARADYSEIGGSPLLGLNAVALVCHGASNASTMATALHLARDCVERQLPAEMARAFEAGMEKPEDTQVG